MSVAVIGLVKEIHLGGEPPRVADYSAAGAVHVFYLQQHTSL